MVRYSYMFTFSFKLLLLYPDLTIPPLITSQIYFFDIPPPPPQFIHGPLKLTFCLFNVYVEGFSLTMNSTKKFLNGLLFSLLLSSLSCSVLRDSPLT